MIDFLTPLHFDGLSMYVPGGSDGKESACNVQDPSSIHESGRSRGEANATHYSILAWRIPWTEDPGRATALEIAKSWTQLSDLHKRIYLCCNTNCNKC